MKKVVLKLFIAVCGFLFGFNIPVVAQYGAPENLYLEKMIQKTQFYIVSPDTLKCVEISNNNVYQIELNEKDFTQKNDSFIWANAPPENSPEEITVYPNPCSEYVNIKLKLNNLNNIKVTLYSINGRLLQKWEFNNQDFRFSMKDYSKGNYLLQVEFFDANINNFRRKDVVLIYQ